jgi:hypothetical protein
MFKFIKTSVALALASLIGLSACGSGGTSIEGSATTAYGPCPHKGLSKLQTQNSEAQDHLVPGGSFSALICRYRESNKIVEGKPSFPLQLSERLISSDRSLAGLTAAFKSLPRARSGEVACPSGIPLHYLVVFHYRHAPQVYVRVSYEGCGYVFNDPRHTVFAATRGLQTTLNALLAPDGTAARS